MNTDNAPFKDAISRSWIKRLAISSPLILFLGGCLAMSLESPAQPADGVDRYQLSELTAQSPSGCQFSYRLFQPELPTTDTWVIVAHGFLRNQDRQVDLSKSLANNGIPVASLNFCNMKPWNGNHKINAQDMQYVASLLETEDNVIYAGFSAGALAAILAATETTQAVFTLDLVDQNTLALDAVKSLPGVPLLSLYGPPSACNANNNALPVYEEKSKQELLNPTGSVSQLVTDASHCEFESPSNWLCEVTCGDKDSDEENANTRTEIVEKTLTLIRSFINPLNPAQQPAVNSPS